MLNKYKFEDKPALYANVTTVTTSSAKSSSSTTETRTFSQTATTLTTGGLSRSVLSSTFSGSPSTSTAISPPYRSAFNNAPVHAYRSFNLKTPIQNTTNNAQEKRRKSLWARLSGDKEKPESFSEKKKEEEKKEKEKKKKEKKEKEKEKEKKEKEKKEKEKKEKEKKEKDNQDTKPKNANLKELPATDARLNGPGGYILNSSDMDKKLVIKVKKSGIIHGNENDRIPTYVTKSRYRRGNVLLINNIKFEGKKYRNGAQVDHDNITKLFKEMGFSITEYKNRNKQDMENVIKRYCENSSLKSADISVTIVMSHGTEDYIETIDKQAVAIEWIVNQFSNTICKNLANKPKIFIFQCCRGGESDMVQTDTTPFLAPRDKADMLLAYATVPGYVSHRDPKFGTWYIQAICKIFMENAHDTDVESLLKIVDNSLAQTYTIARQTSSYENRGFKRCYLNPIK